MTTRRESAQIPEIEVEDLIVRYGSVTAAGPVSFSVAQGEQLTLLGPSGCGKTTTLRAIAGLERPAAGAIRIRAETMYDDAAGIFSELVGNDTFVEFLTLPAYERID